VDIMVNHTEKGKMSTWHYTISGRVNVFMMTVLSD